MGEIALSKVEMLLLKTALRNSDGIFIGGITAKMGVAMSDVVSAFRKLRRQGFLEQRGTTLHLTVLGRNWIMNNQRLFAFTGQTPWRDVPDRFQSNRISVNEPYAPRISKLSKKTFSVG